MGLYAAVLGSALLLVACFVYAVAVAYSAMCLVFWLQDWFESHGIRTSRRRLR